MTRDDYTFAKFLICHRSNLVPGGDAPAVCRRCCWRGCRWRWQSGKLSMLGMFAPRWVAAKVDGGPKRAMNAAYGPTDVAGEPE